MQRRLTNYTSTTTAGRNPPTSTTVTAGDGESSHRSRQQRSNNRRSTLDRSEDDGDVRRQHLTTTTNTRPRQRAEGRSTGVRGPLRQNEHEQLQQLRRRSLQRTNDDDGDDDERNEEEEERRRITLERQLLELDLRRSSGTHHHPQATRDRGSSNHHHRRSSNTSRSTQSATQSPAANHNEQLRRSLQGWQAQHEEQLRNSIKYQALHEEELRRSQQNKAVTSMTVIQKKKQRQQDPPTTPKTINSETITPPFRHTPSTQRRTIAIDPSVGEDNYVRGAGAIYHHPTPQSSSGSTSSARPSSSSQSTSRHCHRSSHHHHQQSQRPAPLPFATDEPTTNMGGEGEDTTTPLLSVQSLSSLNGTRNNNNNTNIMMNMQRGDSSRSSHNTTSVNSTNSRASIQSSCESNESEERRRLEEYAGRRAFQRLEKELEDHSEMSRSVRSDDDDGRYINGTNDGFEEEDDGRIGSDNNNNNNNNDNKGGGGGGGSNSKIPPTAPNNKIRRTTRQGKFKSVMDRRKLAKVPQVKKSDMIIGEYLGRGNFCDVFEVTWVLPTDNNKRLMQKPNIMGGRKQQQQQQSSTARGGGGGSSSSSSKSGGPSTKRPENDYSSSSEHSLNIITSHGHISKNINSNGNDNGRHSRSRRRSTVDSNMTQSSAETLFSLSYSSDLCFDPILNATNMSASANRRSVSQVWVEGTGVLSSSIGQGRVGGSTHHGAAGTSSHSVPPASMGNTWQGSSSLRCNPNALALKCLRPAVRAEPRKFIIGAEDLAHETALLACLDHPNIIQLHGRAEGCFSTAFQMRDKDGGDDNDDYDGGGTVSNGKKQISNEGYFIILDRLMDTLTDRIEEWKDECLAIANIASSPLPHPPQSPPHFTDHDAIESTLRECLRERLKVVYSISDAFEYLHSRNVVFRDLKPANVGFDQNDCVKVFDFGFATSIAPLLSRPYNGYGPLTETCGTRRYMAPEVALKLGYGKEVDVYSFGMLLWEVCALDKPFDTIQSVEEFHDIVVLYGKRPSLHVEPYWPTSLKALMSRCWSTDPLDRPTMVDVKNMLHNVLRDVSGDRNEGSTGAKSSGHGNFMSKWRRRVSL